MKSTAAHVGDKVTDHLVKGQRQEVSPPFNWMHALHQVGDRYPADRVQRNEHTNSCTSSPPPVYLAFDAHPKDQLGPSQLLEWSTVHHTTVRSIAQTRTQPFSIYGTSSDNIMAEEVILEGVLLSQMSGLGSPNIPAPLNYTTMIWERIPASEGSSPKGTYLFHTASQESYYDFGDEIDYVEMKSRPYNRAGSCVADENAFVIPCNSWGRRRKLSNIRMDHSRRSRNVTSQTPSCFCGEPTLEHHHSKNPKEETRTKYPHIPSISSPTTPKMNYNAIEKGYRNRLNGKFEVLLSVLPAREDEGRGESLAKVSKGDVLTLAKGLY